MADGEREGAGEVDGEALPLHTAAEEEDWLASAADAGTLLGGRPRCARPGGRAASWRRRACQLAGWGCCCLAGAAGACVVLAVGLLVVVEATIRVPSVPACATHHAHALEASFLPHWQGLLAPVTGSRSVLDLALAGTHDTVTYDLGTRIIESTNLEALERALAKYSGWLPLIRHLAGRLVRPQAITQACNITTQLNAGIRFLDMRLTYGTKGTWFGLHGTVTRAPFDAYFGLLADWLRAHPTEVRRGGR